MSFIIKFRDSDGEAMTEIYENKNDLDATLEVFKEFNFNAVWAEGRYIKGE